MKNLKRIDEAVGSILERRASADRLLKDVVKGNASEVEGIKLSKEMADAFLMWLKGSTYGKKFGALPFYKLFSAAPNWGLDRYIGKDKKIKDEFKELKAKAKEMSKAEMKGESLNEKSIKDWFTANIDSFKDEKEYMKAGKKTGFSKKELEAAMDDFEQGGEDYLESYDTSSIDEAIDLLKSTWRGTKGWNDVARIMDAGLMKAIKAGSVPLSYAKDYVKSLERMAKRNAKKFFDEYGNFSEDDFIEDVEYNMANESKVNEAKFNFSEDEVKNVADLIAKAIAKMDKSKTAVHDMEYDAGRGAGFEISMDGEKYEGGSYVVRPNGEVYNAAIGNSFPNAIYAKIGDNDINKIIKNIKKFESVAEAKDFTPHKMYDPETGDEYEAEKPEDHERMAKLGYVHEKPESVDEARFVKSYDKRLDNAKTKKEVLKLYPKAEFFVGKSDHFFGELEPNLFFKSYYTKGQKEFRIKSVYSKKGSNYVHLYNRIGESVMENFESYSQFVSENYDTEQRKKMAEKGFALADGSFPIANLEDLKNAIQAYGRAKDQAKAAKFIVKRAKALGAEDLVPDTDDFQKSLDEVYTQVPAKTIAITEGTDIGSWNQGGLKGNENVLITTFVGPKDIEDFGLGRKCMQINVGRSYVSLNPADITELKDILKSYKVK